MRGIGRHMQVQEYSSPEMGNGFLVDSIYFVLIKLKTFYVSSFLILLLKIFNAKTKSKKRAKL